jgi:hypothetical protein
MVRRLRGAGLVCRPRWRSGTRNFDPSYEEVQRLRVGLGLAMSVELAALAFPFAETFVQALGCLVSVFFAVGAIALIAN